ncbi:MAG TPA: Fe-S cluster assembly ATPase SufC [Steroidobacteraceae bacterium]|nr:Fe-S cluster assembly ATPase SufC [Steroidobacteraceae bacterium]
MNMPLLSIRNLHVNVADREVLRGIDLELPAGQVHAIMGPNGSGKSSLSHVLAGKPGYAVTAGTVDWQGQDLLSLPPEERARDGLFLGFQYPVEIPGVNNAYLLRAALNAARRARGESELDAFDFLSLVKERMALMKMDEAFLSRGVNEGFSGGEKKRNEILQMLVLQPRLAILDETDSGLDIDALKVVAGGINSLRSPERAILLVTHYQRLLDHVRPDRVHVLARGRIVKSGGPELAHELEQRGYDWLAEEAA